MRLVYHGCMGFLLGADERGLLKFAQKIAKGGDAKDEPAKIAEEPASDGKREPTAKSATDGADDEWPIDMNAARTATVKSASGSKGTSFGRDGTPASA